MARVNPVVVVSQPIKTRLEEMRLAMVEAKGRTSITYMDVLEWLLEEHDRNAREEAGA